VKNRPKRLTKQNVVERLEERRQGRTLEVFAKEIGVSRQQLWNVLRGSMIPGRKFLNYLGLHRVVVPAEPVFEESHAEGK
jgi:transcriptional regulator with XRE-family HTH domain